MLDDEIFPKEQAEIVEAWVEEIVRRVVAEVDEEKRRERVTAARVLVLAVLLTVVLSWVLWR